MPEARIVRVPIETDHGAATLRKALSNENCTVGELKGPFRKGVKTHHVIATPRPSESDAEVKNRIEAAWDDYLTLNGLLKKPPPPKKKKWKK